jgi:hypothetical protein
MEGCLAQVGLAEIAATQRSLAQIGPYQIRLAQICLAEISSTEVGLPEIDLAQVVSMQVLAAKIYSTQTEVPLGMLCSPGIPDGDSLPENLQKVLLRYTLSLLANALRRKGDRWAVPFPLPRFYDSSPHSCSIPSFSPLLRDTMGSRQLF